MATGMGLWNTQINMTINPNTECLLNAKRHLTVKSGNMLFNTMKAREKKQEAKEIALSMMTAPK
jgi:hypothetical protein